MDLDIQEIFPPGYSYIIISKTLNQDKVLEEAVVRVNLFSEKEAMTWRSEFQDISNLNFTVLRTHPNAGEEARILFKKDYKCHHNTGADWSSSSTKKAHAKHTNCRGFLRITVKNPMMKRSKDEHLKTHPCEVLLKNNHNHLVICADVLRHLKPNEETKEKILKLFSSGHSPSSALDIIKYDLQEKYGADYLFHAADGGECPSLRHMYYAYYKTFEKHYGAAEGEAMVQSLNEFIDSYNQKCGSVCAKCEYENGELIVVICSPLAKRVHENLRSSGEIMFVDASGTMDRHNSRVFTFLTHSVAGSLPLGLAIVFSESENVVTKALQLWKSILPEKAFFNHNEGPKVIMTDDSTSERNSLRNVFALAVLLLCRFHILQALWRYLLLSKNGVKQNHRAQIFNMFRTLFDCKTVESAKDQFQKIINGVIISKYPNIKQYFENLMTRAEEWCPAYINHLITRGHTTNNVSEANFRIIKDKIMERLKAYSVVQLFDFLTTRYDSFFEKRLADYLANRNISETRKRYCIPEEKTKNLQVTKFTEDIYLVENITKKTKYEVNTLLEVCSCPVGLQGCACKHQFAVVLKYNLFNNQISHKNDHQMKLIFHKILLGSTDNIPKGWYNNIKDTSTDDPNFSVEREPEDYIQADVNEDIANENVEEITSEKMEDEGVRSESDTTNTAKMEVIDKLNTFLEEMKDQLDKPDVLEATSYFLKNFNKLKSTAALCSALKKFGKNIIFEGKSRKRNYIQVQNTAVARRTVYKGGSKVQFCGRPPKKMRKEHSYAGGEKNQENLMPRRRRKMKAPHDLLHCVENTMSLGKRH